MTLFLATAIVPSRRGGSIDRTPGVGRRGKVTLIDPVSPRSRKDPLRSAFYRPSRWRSPGQPHEGGSASLVGPAERAPTHIACGKPPQRWVHAPDVARRAVEGAGSGQRAIPGWSDGLGAID